VGAGLERGEKDLIKIISQPFFSDSSGVNLNRQEEEAATR
jgi:hypothetical protein